jgi:hypothetical protein
MKLGRQPRSYNPRIPFMSALIRKATPMVLPPSVDYAGKMPDSLGMMLNDQLGDCTCAAYYHAIQVWSFNASGVLVTEPDQDVLDLYEGACGYVPNNPSTDQGGNEQTVLTYLMNQGAPTGMQAQTRHKLRAFVEVDVRNLDDVKRSIYECGVTYIGFNVPASIMPQGGTPPSVWDVGGDSTIIGGHAIVLTGYNDQGFNLISWGMKYIMTYAFFSQFTDESYALCDIDWFQGTGKSLLGMTVPELEQQMQALKQ